MPAASQSPPPRLQPVDALRGLIMMIMALDHARAFIVREHPFEIWSAPLPVYTSNLPFLTRLPTHLCAPAFFFLMGVGMALLTSARRDAGWSPLRIARYFATRGAVILVVEQLLENPAWFLGMAGAAAPDAFAGPDSTSGGPMIVLGVLYALSAAMIFWSLLATARTSLVVGLSLAAIIATQILIPAQSEGGMAFSPLSRLLLVPGTTGIWFVIYPALPWLGLTGLGLAFGRDLSALTQRALTFGALALAVFFVVRVGGGFGNIHVPVPGGWIGFLNLTKYPPSVAFVAFTLAVNLSLLAAINATWSRLQPWASAFLVFGRTALFFYIVHLYLFALMGWAFPHGAHIAMVYPFWILGLVILYPLCRRYQQFKFGKPADSYWRLF